MHYFRCKTWVAPRGVKSHCLLKTLQSLDCKEEKVFPRKFGLNISGEYAFNHMGNVRAVGASASMVSPVEEGAALWPRFRRFGAYSAGTQPWYLHYFRCKTGAVPCGVKSHCLLKTLQSLDCKEEKVFPRKFGLNISGEYAFNHMGNVRAVGASASMVSPVEEGAALWPRFRRFGAYSAGTQPWSLHYFRCKTGVVPCGVKSHCLLKTLQSLDCKEEKVFPWKFGLNISGEYAFKHMGNVRAVGASAPMVSPVEGRGRRGLWPRLPSFRSLFRWNAALEPALFPVQNWGGPVQSQESLSVENAAITRLQIRKSFSPEVRA